MAFPLLSRSPAPIRMLAFLLVLLAIWLPVAAPIYLLLNHDPNLVSILTMVLLYGEFIWLLRVWGRSLYGQPRMLQTCGLIISLQNGLGMMQGLAIGLFSLFGLFILEGWLGWLRWQIGPAPISILALEGLAVALGVGFAEELFFRGWILQELERDYKPTVALWVNALFFAFLHFIKPIPEILRTWPQFAGLCLLGLILVWAKRRRHWGQSNQPTGGWLGLPIGLHAGLVWGYYLINVGQLATYSGQVPTWVTGVDNNPLAGVMGLVFLGGIALLVRSGI
ncbi:abortive phage infection protein [Leptolyngbya sp. 'hensonii']|uniref:CPBP family intramembrane glutamic endopeptidase n=1 Tax=Leptolyngbya sp. 'hensonii' TaxID=1922337 RepID=UPI00094FBED8|nr:type II CAAX endopeptidase family protein [Leptolyngbya sp. 'hensonii']OLP18810.1 abortive phage infection protein [Leptolyngbya sp. 'hensonii']